MVMGVKAVKMTGTSSPFSFSRTSCRWRSSRALLPWVQGQTVSFRQSAAQEMGVLTTLATPPLTISE